jgi:hypothetical protein
VVDLAVDDVVETGWMVTMMMRSVVDLEAVPIDVAGGAAVDEARKVHGSAEVSLESNVAVVLAFAAEACFATADSASAVVEVQYFLLVEVDLGLVLDAVD